MVKSGRVLAAYIHAGNAVNGLSDSFSGSSHSCAILTLNLELFNPFHPIVPPCNPLAISHDVKIKFKSDIRISTTLDSTFDNIYQSHLLLIHQKLFIHVYIYLCLHFRCFSFIIKMLFIPFFSFLILSCK